MTTVRIPFTKTALIKLALSLQELSKATDDSYITIDNVTTDQGTLNFIFIKSLEKEV